MLMVSSAFRVLLMILLCSLVLTLFSVLKDLSLSAVLTGMTISTDASSLMLEEFHQLLLRQAVILPNALTQTVPLILDSVRFKNPPQHRHRMCHIMWRHFLHEGFPVNCHRGRSIVVSL